MSFNVKIEIRDFLAHMFATCTLEQANEFVPERRGFRIHGRSTTIRLERVFWSVLEDMAQRLELDMPELVARIHDECMLANDKNLSSCLRVVCLKYLNIYAT